MLLVLNVNEDYVYTREDLSGLINVSGFITLRVFSFVGVYTKGCSDSQPFTHIDLTHIDKSEDIHARTVTKQVPLDHAAPPPPTSST